MKKLLALAVLAACASAHSHTVIGMVNCGQWGTLGTKIHGKGWMLGYLSALNGQGVSNGNADALTGTSADQLTRWMDNYCKASALSDSGEGTRKLYDELLQRAKR